MLHSICQQIWKTQQWSQDWKMSVFIPIPRTDNAIECSNYCTIARISHASEVMLKILQARLQQYVKCEFPDVQAVFRKVRGTIDQTANIRLDHQKSKRVPEKHLLLLYWLCQILWLCGSQQTVQNTSRDGNTRAPECFLINLQVKNQQLELDMEQKLVPNRERSTSRLYIVTLLI